MTLGTERVIHVAQLFFAHWSARGGLVFDLRSESDKLTALFANGPTRVRLLRIR